MTRRALSPDLTADHTMADLPTSRAHFFSRARSTSGRFFMCERESETEMRGEGLWESLITIKRGEREGEGEEQPRSRAPSWIFCKDDGDGNENVKKGHVHQQNNNFACAAFSFPISCSCTTTTLKIFLLKIPRFDWGRQHEDRISLSGDRLLVRIIKSSQLKARNKRLSFLARLELYNCIVIKAKHCGISWLKLSLSCHGESTTWPKETMGPCGRSVWVNSL